MYGQVLHHQCPLGVLDRVVDCQAWLDEVTVAKIDIVSSAYVKEKLLSQIPAENLPAEFGGRCQCVGGCSLSDVGPWNPQTVPNGEA